MNAQMPSAVLIERGIRIPAQDGVVLVADLYRPQVAIPVPALLQQIPYGRSYSAMSIVDAGLEPIAAAEAGFAVIITDVRGTGESHGQFTLFEGAGGDGAAVASWIVNQPWSDGSICTYGTSFSGYTALATAAASPHVTASSTLLTGGLLPHRDFTRTNGMLNLGFLAYWALAGLGDVRTTTHSADESSATTRDAAINNIDEIYTATPVIHALSYDLAPTWRSLVYGMGDDPVDTVPPPTLSYTGWYDIFLRAALDRWTVLNARFPDPRHRLVIGPWSHGNFSDSVGGVFMGAHAALSAHAASQTRLDFFRRVIDGEQPGGEAVTYFVQGAGTWASAPSWPPPAAAKISFAVLDSGLCRIDRDSPGTGRLDKVLQADPYDPVPTVSGNTYLPGVVQSLNGGPRDRSQIHTRPDVLIFDSPVLDQPLLLAGPVVLTIDIDTDAPSFDLHAHLCELTADGRARPFTDGATRVVQGQGRSDAAVNVEMNDTCIRVPAGARLRLEISTSDFPRYDRNPHNGVDALTATADDFTPVRLRLTGSKAGSATLELLVLPT